MSSGLLRICTAGSVDDGKSTLIGRLLYDSRSVYEDQLHSIQRASKNRSAGAIDFSLFTDGLRAEREQGITIDVAYRYFATARRKFILADTPGHEQYTRNMATGASTADVAILLVDARHGVRPQSRRHAQIARLLGIKDYVVAVNKMDLVEFERSVFDNIVDEFDQILAGAKLHPIPISALHGDNVIGHSERTPWFDGQPLLEFLETVEVERAPASQPFRFPVQLVLRPTHEFRGYAGQILSGSVRRGDAVTTWPTGRSSRVKQIVTFDGELDVAHAGQSITLTLEDEIDISRGDMITTGETNVARRFRADVVWMDERALDPSRVYVLKHTTRTVTAELDRTLALNQIGSVTVTTARPVMIDCYVENRGTGSFIIVDPATNFTAGAGMIAEVLRENSGGAAGRPSAAERLARVARGAATDAEAVEAVRKALEDLLA
ncbi:MAG TPA: GTP-binding protein [Vicinamibacterales bacterium]|nr:GTP-binding protein [Vicinamibacterales bacterium]